MHTTAIFLCVVEVTARGIGPSRFCSRRRTHIILCYVWYLYIIHIICFDRIKICYRSSIFCIYYYILFFFYIVPIVSPPFQRMSVYYNTAHNADVRLFINIILYHSPELDKGEQKPHIKTRERLSAASAFVPCKFSEKNA